MPFIEKDHPTVQTLPSPSLHPEQLGHTLGGKSLNFWFSFVYIINQIYGPGVLAIPIVFQQSGWFPTIGSLFFFMITSCFAATLLCQAIALMPGNRKLTFRHEFSTALAYYYSRPAYLFSQFLLNLTIQSYNLSSIVICAQSIDTILSSIIHKSYALVFYAEGNILSTGFVEVANIEDLYSADQYCIAISLGYVIIMALFLPQGFLNLDDNVKSVQLISFLFFFAIMIEFIVYFVKEGVEDGMSTVPFVGTTYSQIVSVFIFSWAFVVFVPSWLNEKKEDVSVNKVIWWSGLASFIGYVGFGILCAAVDNNIKLDNVLVSLSQDTIPIVTRITAQIFAFFVIAPGIPVCSVTTRYNLEVSGVTGVKGAYFWGAVAPWIVGFLFSSGQVFANLLVWSSLLCNGVVNIIIPFHLYIIAMRQKKAQIIDQGTDEVNVSLLRNDIFCGIDSPTEEHSVRKLRTPPFSPLSINNDTDPFPLLRSTMSDLEMRGVSDDEIYEDMSLHEPFHPYPQFCEGRAVEITFVLLVLTILAITGQVVFDFVYLFRGQNLLENS